MQTTPRTPFRNRLRLYHELTEPVVERYRSDGTLVAVDGDRPIPEVAADDRGSAGAGGSPLVIIRKSEREIEKIAAAGALVAETIAHVG